MNAPDTLASKFTPRDVTLRDGRVVTLREPAEDDAAAMIAYLDVLRREAPFIMFAPEDELPALEEERAIIRGTLGPDALWLLAIHDGNIVGSGNVRRYKRFKESHRAGLGIATRAAFRGQGLGRAIMAELIGFCRRHDGIEQLELCVFVGNVPARRMYEGLGFTVTGRTPNAFRNADGTAGDELHMVLHTPATR